MNEPEQVMDLEDAENRSKIKATLKTKLKNRRWRLNNLYKIINEDGVEIQFRMNLVQRLLYLGLHFCNIVLKSRQHGITTFSCVFFLDTCLFKPNKHACIIAHNREEAEAFFERNIKYAYDKLPADLREAVPIKPGTFGSSRKIVFANNSSIRVTTSGRSGTYQLVHISELGKIAAKYPEKAREIITGTLNAVHPGQIVIIESTAEGREGVFYDICQMAMKMAQAHKELGVMDYKFFFFPWFRNPLNQVGATKLILLDYQLKYFNALARENGIVLTVGQKAWYVAKWNIMGEDMKREHPSTPQEAFAAAVMGTFYSTSFERIRNDERICTVPHIPNGLVDTWWDIGMNDSTAIFFTQDVGREIHIINYYENSGEGFEHYKDVLDELHETKGYKYGVHGAPHDISVREWFLSGKTRLQAAADLGVQFHKAPKISVASGIEQVRKILNICIFDEKNTTQKFGSFLVGLPSLEAYRKQWNEKLGCYRDKPLHDWASNGADAFRTFATLHKFRSPFIAVQTELDHLDPNTGLPFNNSSPAVGIARKDKGWWT
jgi:hypothetical protein